MEVLPKLIITYLIEGFQYLADYTKAICVTMITDSAPLIISQIAPEVSTTSYWLGKQIKRVKNTKIRSVGPVALASNNSDQHSTPPVSVRLVIFD